MATSEVLAELQKAEAQVLRLLEIAGNVTDSLAHDSEQCDDNQMKADVAEFFDLVKNVHGLVEPKIALLSAFEPHQSTSYQADLKARINSAI